MYNPSFGAAASGGVGMFRVLSAEPGGNEGWKSVGDWDDRLRERCEAIGLKLVSAPPKVWVESSKVVLEDPVTQVRYLSQIRRFVVEEADPRLRQPRMPSGRRAVRHRKDWKTLLDERLCETGMQLGAPLPPALRSTTQLILNDSQTGVPARITMGRFVTHRIDPRRREARKARNWTLEVDRRLQAIELELVAAAMEPLGALTGIEVRDPATDIRYRTRVYEFVNGRDPRTVRRRQSQRAPRRATEAAS